MQNVWNAPPEIYNPCFKGFGDVVFFRILLLWFILTEAYIIRKLLSFMYKKIHQEKLQCSFTRECDKGTLWCVMRILLI